MRVENIGKNLKQIREVLEMTQAELAKLTEMTPAAISQIESGERVPALESTLKIIKALNISFERLLK